MDYEKYKNKLEYPRSPIKPLLFKETNAAAAKEYAEKLEAWEGLCQEYKEKKEKYREEDGRLHEEFRKDLLEEFGISNHPNADNIFAYAWERGHDYGYSEVYSVMSEMSEYKLF